MDIFNSKKETTKIIRFLRSVFEKTKKQKVVIAWSGGIDSTVCLYLLAQSLSPKNITVLHLPFETSHEREFVEIAHKLNLSPTQLHTVSIQQTVTKIQKDLKINDPIRLGNVMARVRMIVIYDYAKKINALVCGTENRTEELLGYFTRFGDQASDIEPIRHLFKTQIYKLASYLKIPDLFISRAPSAELWKGQTDEGEFGFTYEQADEVLFRFFDKNMTIKNIEKDGFVNPQKIIGRVTQNTFKHEVPYSL